MITSITAKRSMKRFKILLRTPEFQTFVLLFFFFGFSFGFFISRFIRIAYCL